eukprot:scaffold4212_cov122-Isochrysis_galbana.AAC.10
MALVDPANGARCTDQQCPARRQVSKGDPAKDGLHRRRRRSHGSIMLTNPARGWRQTAPSAPSAHVLQALSR